MLSAAKRVSLARLFDPRPYIRCTVYIRGQTCFLFDFIAFIPKIKSVHLLFIKISTVPYFIFDRNSEWKKCPRTYTLFRPPSCTHSYKLCDQNMARRAGAGHTLCLGRLFDPRPYVRCTVLSAAKRVSLARLFDPRPYIRCSVYIRGQTCFLFEFIAFIPKIKSVH